MHLFISCHLIPDGPEVMHNWWSLKRSENSTLQLAAKSWPDAEENFNVHLDQSRWSAVLPGGHMEPLSIWVLHSMCAFKLGTKILFYSQSMPTKHTCKFPKKSWSWWRTAKQWGNGVSLQSLKIHLTSWLTSKDLLHKVKYSHHRPIPCEF